MNEQVSIPEHCQLLAPKPTLTGRAPSSWGRQAGPGAGWGSVHAQAPGDRGTDLALRFHPRRAPFLHL